MTNAIEHSGDGSGYLEHPIQKKDGSSIVVLCYGRPRGGTSQISEILITDITHHIEAHNTVIQQAKENRLLLKKLSFISENEEEYILDYNCSIDHFDITIIKDGEMENILCSDNYSTKLYHNETIHPDDLAEYIHVFQQAPKLKNKTTFDFRSTLFTSEYNWYRATYAPYLDEETNETHVIGRITDVDSEVTKHQELQRQAQTDALTSLYNQGTSRAMIDRIARENPADCINAFIILDIDNFKAVNDTFGHAQGDEVLRHIGKTLKNSFRFSIDVTGRLGGDEFVVFMRNVPSHTIVLEHCRELCEKLHDFSFQAPEEFHITVSIGIALQESGPDTFEHLYKHADKALYHQKSTGKNGASIYNTTH